MRCLPRSGWYLALEHAAVEITVLVHVLIAHDQHLVVDKASVQGGAPIADGRPREVRIIDLGAGVIR